MILAYQEVQQMMIFFTGKNALVMLQMYRLVVLKLDKKSSDSKKVSNYENDLIPLRGVLQDLSMQNGLSLNYLKDKVISNATFKTKSSGDVIIKMTLDGRLIGKKGKLLKAN